MRVPVSWLRELVPVDTPTAELAERLSLSGTSVESIERVGGAVSGVVVAKVLEVSAVAGSDKLVVAQVDAGSQGRHQVVAGARNFAAGDVVPLARPGARVTTLDAPIGVRTMLGKYESQGMLCSALELGLGEDHSGILHLEPDAPLGADVGELLGLDDEVLDLEILANRPDLLSIIGVAREVSVLFGVPLRTPPDEVVEDGPEASSLAAVELEDRDGCPRYLARVIEDVSFGPAPASVQARLVACGIRPLGNLVDATNYVLELTGQPLHAFDLDRLAGQRVVVRRARAGEELTTLDDVRRRLDPEDLVVADAQRPQALAGIMGGADSEVNASTRRILLESAHFAPRPVFRTARRVELRTGASQRFEKGTDPAMVPQAAALCAELIRRWAGGRVARGAVDVGTVPQRPSIGLRHARVPVIMGVDIPRGDAERILTGLGCRVEGGERARVTPPSWRPDLEREIDLIEEIARIWGYDRTPMRVPTGERGFLTRSQLLRRRVREVLLGAGLSEATTLSLLSDEDLRAVGAADGIAVTNPMSSEQGIMRPSLVPGLLRAAQRNVHRGTRDVHLFELGSVWTGWDEKDDLPTEVERVATVLTGHADGPAWYAEDRAVDSFDVTGLAEAVLAELGIEGWSFGPCERMPMHPGRAATVVVEGTAVGVVGELRPSVARAFDLEGGAAVLELDLQPLFERTPDALVVREVPRFPPVLRDIALAVDETVRAGDVSATIRSAGGPMLESVTLVDVYRGAQVGEARRSLAFRLTFRAPDRTLRSDEADAARDAVAVALRDGHGADIR